MIPAIERMLGERIDCRRIEGFDYAEPAPSISPNSGRSLLASTANGAKRGLPINGSLWSRKAKRGLPASNRRHFAISGR